jgi:hypothetical protein
MSMDPTLLSQLPVAISTAKGLLTSNTLLPSLLIEKYPPTIHRVSFQLGENFVFLHRMFQSDESPYPHSHSWPFICHVLEGSYEMWEGTSHTEDRLACPPLNQYQVIQAGDTYGYSSSKTWHSVAPITSVSMSIMIVGPRWRERLAQNNRQLATMDYDALVYEFKRIWGLL